MLSPLWSQPGCLFCFDILRQIDPNLLFISFLFYHLSNCAHPVFIIVEASTKSNFFASRMKKLLFVFKANFNQNVSRQSAQKNEHQNFLFCLLPAILLAFDLYKVAARDLCLTWIEKLHRTCYLLSAVIGYCSGCSIALSWIAKRLFSFKTLQQSFALRQCCDDGSAFYMSLQVHHEKLKMKWS